MLQEVKLRKSYLNLISLWPLIKTISQCNQSRKKNKYFNMMNNVILKSKAKIKHKKIILTFRKAFLKKNKMIRWKLTKPNKNLSGNFKNNSNMSLNWSFLGRSLRLNLVWEIKDSLFQIIKDFTPRLLLYLKKLIYFLKIYGIHIEKWATLEFHYIFIVENNNKICWFWDLLLAQFKYIKAWLAIRRIIEPKDQSQQEHLLKIPIALNP